MNCASCSKDMIEIKNGEAELRVNGRLFLVRNVTFMQCRECGERVFSPEVSQWIYSKIQNGDYKEETIVLPVLSGTYG
ncbi:MAG: YgiT-type zinc finger protein [Candidatus Wallbacteria bacterium]|nr:YgiT-type zinc finger protein [Candidatus Wallbacteria bacterium]